MLAVADRKRVERIVSLAYFRWMDSQAAPCAIRPGVRCARVKSMNRKNGNSRRKGIGSFFKEINGRTIRNKILLNLPAREKN